MSARISHASPGIMPVNAGINAVRERIGPTAGRSAMFGSLSAGATRWRSRMRLLLVGFSMMLCVFSSPSAGGIVPDAARTTGGPFLRTSTGSFSSGHEVESRTVLSVRTVGSRSFGSAGEVGLVPGMQPSRAWEQMSGDGASSTTARNPHLRSIGLSILLPGLAQYQMGHTLRATGYFAAEAAFWSAFAAYRVQGSNREDSYHQMAELFAGVQDPGSRDDEYYKTIAGWPSSELYNEIVVRREARQEHGDDLAAREAYYESNKIQGDEAWSWVSDAARERYRDKRNDAQRSFKNSRNMIGLAVANRLVSMIDAVLLERRHSSLRLELAPDRASQGARISISRAVP